MDSGMQRTSKEVRGARLPGLGQALLMIVQTHGRAVQRTCPPRTSSCPARLWNRCLGPPWAAAAGCSWRPPCPPAAAAPWSLWMGDNSVAWSIASRGLSAAPYMRPPHVRQVALPPLDTQLLPSSSTPHFPTQASPPHLVKEVRRAAGGDLQDAIRKLHGAEGQRYAACVFENRHSHASACARPALMLLW